MTNTYYETEAKYSYESDTVYDEVENGKSADILRKAPFMEKWLTRLFWLIILMNILNIMTIDIIAERLPILALLCTGGYFICNILCGFIFWVMKAESHRYKSVAYCIWVGILTVSLNDLFNIVPPVHREFVAQEYGITMFLMLAVLFTLVVVLFYGIYSMCMGHAEVLRDVDAALSEKWKKLWKLFIETVILAILAVFHTVFLSMVISVVIAAVLVIMMLIYLYRMTKLFRKYCAG